MLWRSLLFLLFLGIPACASEVDELVEACDAELLSIGAEVDQAVLLAEAITGWGVENGEPRAECRGLIRQVFAEVRLGRWTTSWRDQRLRAAELASQIPTDAIERAEWLVFNGALDAMFFDAYDDGLRQMREAIAIGEVLGDFHFLAKAHLVLSEVLALRYESLSLLESSVRSWRLSAYTNNKELEARSLRNLIILSAFNWNDATPYFPRYRELCGDLGHTALTPPVDEQTTRDLQEVVAETRYSVETKPPKAKDWLFVADQRRLADACILMVYGYGFLQDDWDQAEPYLDLMELAMTKLRDQTRLREAGLYRAMILARKGQIDDALAKMSDKVKELADTQQHDRLASIYAMMARQLVISGRNDESLRLLDLSHKHDSIEAASLPSVARESAEQYLDFMLVKSEASRVQSAHVAADNRAKLVTAVLVTTVPVLAALVWMWVRAARGEAVQRVLSARLVEESAAADEARRRAEQADQAKTDYLARINHELRNPLAAIVSSCATLEQDVDPKAAQHARETIAAATGGLVDVIDEVLDFTRIEAGRLENRPSSVEPQRVLRAVAAIAQVELNDGVDLVAEVRRGVPKRVRCDLPKLRQVLLNLCTNSARHTSHGRIEVVCDYAGDYAGDVAGGELQVRVEDTGCGISEDRLERVFQRYESSGDRPGSGLGLYISKAFVDCMGGRLTCQSSVGVGTTMTVRIPVEVDASEAEPAPAVPATPHGVSRVLVVDDQPANAESLAALLNACGLEAVTANGADEAVEAVSDGVDAALLDLRMPRVSGYELAERLRALPGPAPMLIATTGDATEATRERAMQSGFAAFLAKPFTREELVAVLGGAPPVPTRGASSGGASVGG